MAHVPGTADENRGRVPAVLESYAFIRDHVLLDGPADREIKQLCFRFLAGEIEPSAYEGRERAALDWAYAIAWDSDSSGDALWERLKSFFTEEELVDLGCAIGFELGQQHFVRTLGLTPELPHSASA